MYYMTCYITNIYSVLHNVLIEKLKKIKFLPLFKLTRHVILIKYWKYNTSCNTEYILVIFYIWSYGFLGPMVFYLFSIYSVIRFWSNGPVSFQSQIKNSLCYSVMKWVITIKNYFGIVVICEWIDWTLSPHCS